MLLQRINRRRYSAKWVRFESRRRVVAANIVVSYKLLSPGTMSCTCASRSTCSCHRPVTSSPLDPSCLRPCSMLSLCGRSTQLLPSTDAVIASDYSLLLVDGSSEYLFGIWGRILLLLKMTIVLSPVLSTGSKVLRILEYDEPVAPRVILGTTNSYGFYLRLLVFEALMIRS